MYNNLRYEMKISKVNNGDLMRGVGISYQSVSNKLCGRTSFKIEEAIIIRNLFFPTLELEYLFKKTN